MTTHHSDSGIPLLTEIIASPGAKVGASPLLPPKQEQASDIPTATENPVNQQLTQTVNNLVESVLQRALERIDSVLEERIRDKLADVLQIAVRNLSAEIKHGLQQTLEEVIVGVVAQELSQLHITKNQPS